MLHPPSHTLGVAVLLGGLGVLGLVVVGTSRSTGPGPTPQPQPQPCQQGQVPIVLIAQGPGTVSGCGGSTRSQAQVCPWFGEACVYTAWPDSGATFRGWQGPNGITASTRSISPPAQQAGFVRAVFDPAPGIVSRGPNGEIGFNPPSIPIPGIHFEWTWDHVNIAGHWFSIPDFRI